MQHVGRGPAGPDGTFDGGGQAGRGPVAGQRQVARARVRAPGRRASCAGGGGEGGALLLHHPPRRHRAARGRAARAHLGPDRWPRASSAGSVDQAVGGADGDRDDAGLDEHPFRRAADQADEAGLRPGSASMRKCRLRIASNGPARSGRAAGSAATGAGTARTTLSPAPTAIGAVRRWRAPVTRPPRDAQRGDAAAGTAPARRARCSAASAGSTKLSDRPSRGKRGMQAAPPRSSVSRITAPSSGRCLPRAACSAPRWPAARSGGGASVAARQAGRRRCRVAAGARAARSRRGVVARAARPARGGTGRAPTRACGRRLGRSVQRSPVREVEEREQRPRRPAQRVRACRSGRDRPRSRGCPTAAGGCRCRCGSRARGRNRSGSGRRRRGPPRTP